MKRILLFSLVAVCIQFYSCTTTVHVVAEPPVSAPAPAGVSYQTFYDELGPYGHWINNPGYGYVWMPAVDAGFRPYATNGHWLYSDAGWTWVSDYPWGWAVFHYGRWFYEDGYGWMWVPGHEWAPAWVSWRRGTDVYGWAPLSPGVSAAASFNNYDPPANYWCFVPHQYVTSPHVNNYYADQAKNTTIIKTTTIINNTTVNNYGSNNSTSINSNNNNNSNNQNNNNTNNSNNGNNSHNNNGNNSNRQAVYAAGPDKNEVEQVTNTHIQPVALREGSKPGNEQAGNGQLVVYRPIVAPATSNTQNKPAPVKIESLKEMKPVTPVNNAPVAVAPAPVNNGGTAPIKKEPAAAQPQPVQHGESLPAANSNAGKPATIKTDSSLSHVRKDQSANINQPDKTAIKPVLNPPPATVKNPSPNNKNTVPVNAPGADKPLTAVKPGIIKPDSNKLNPRKPVADSLKKMKKPPPAVKNDTEKNNEDSHDRKTGRNGMAVIADEQLQQRLCH
jgi:hypothetical protein